MPLEPVRRRSTSDAVFDQLLDELLGGGIPPGSTLPAERALTDELKVSRQAIREALQRLAQAGLVDINHGGATKALDYRRHGGLDLLPLLLASPESPAPAVIRSVMEMRACIGPDVARLCAERATVAVVDRITDLVAEMAAETELPARAHLDLDLWDALVDGSDNVAYRLAYNSLRRTYEPLIPGVAPLIGDELNDTGARRALAHQVSQGDGSAAARTARRLLAKGSAAIAATLLEREDGG